MGSVREGGGGLTASSLTVGTEDGARGRNQINIGLEDLEIQEWELDWEVRQKESGG